MLRYPQPLILLIACCFKMAETEAFIDIKLPVFSCKGGRWTLQLHADHDGLNAHAAHTSSSRRRFFGALGTAGLVALTGNAAEARDELFKPNPLTNPLLEQVSRELSEAGFGYLYDC
jgi:hypothetical protein